ncbi:hypothetical protein Q9233_013300 [Columba guinea]|nr:hypothetical protein Q9233_013300 [Columba guinea]
MEEKLINPSQLWVVQALQQERNPVPNQQIDNSGKSFPWFQMKIRRKDFHFNVQPAAVHLNKMRSDRLRIWKVPEDNWIPDIKWEACLSQKMEHATCLHMLTGAIVHEFAWTVCLTNTTLSTSDDVEDRETEKGRLEEAYEKCDRDLDELINLRLKPFHDESSSGVLIVSLQPKERPPSLWYFGCPEIFLEFRVKENLLSCKMLLHCKRDELRKLWIEGIEHKHVLNLLDEIENIKQVPQKLEQCMASKRYLNATDMLDRSQQINGRDWACEVECVEPGPVLGAHLQDKVSAVDSLEGPLLQVEGLSDLRLELHSKKMNMHLVLIDELHRHLYIKSTNRVSQRSKEKGRMSPISKGSQGNDGDPFYERLRLVESLRSTRRNKILGVCLNMRETSLLEMKEDTDLDPEENSTVFMGVLIKGLAKLKKIPETVKAIQDRLEQELKQIVKRSTTQVADNGYQRGENLSQENQPRLLLELLELLFDKFNAVAAAHSVVLGHLQQTVASPCSQYDGDIKLYDMVDVWVKIQDVLQDLERSGGKEVDGTRRTRLLNLRTDLCPCFNTQDEMMNATLIYHLMIHSRCRKMLLTEYLDMKNTRTASEPSAQLSYASSGREFAAFFAKKKPQRPKNPLFKFESSSHAISMSAYLREQRRELYSRSGELQGEFVLELSLTGRVGQGKQKKVKWLHRESP